MARLGARIALAALLIATLSGCAHGGGQPDVRPASDPNFLAGCGPLEDPKLAAAIGVSALHRQSSPTICNWTATAAGGGTVDLTYAWLRDDSLSREVQVADQFGYRIERLVAKHFGGMYWRDPKDPGSCAVTVADTGTVTWWVQNREHAAQSDPCAAAMKLMDATLSVDGI
ncbi:DUF3558 domain-containing protein [Nocardia seriolae]|uniref:DUF3558 domain-containing protein n=1 Tax=Nocardia seriolae TaxID=37332 RepID=A0ABC8AS09_9NOCA|nr:DUF3558 domain-containing protein [Nocardia seriolae]APA96762.1 hypothetical protein NS506_02701 [Nocardia seriolae]OJF79020.1 hypothetical protein NS14008_07095 [Nocardia seriolae]PSK26546.1 DUF3558 domain-containing protein [Nocardia seriolae]QOW30693.1 DUF3558 domain-containing protein [Nocardia seriolae]QUN15379.1 DUF3558 domain-containing protein [Nocardia seriolae]